ncbi:MAG TPA: methylmalonyl Co-A mutase-associated GTPase MeaB [Caldimonas sp.]|nr:methylmalonyl Co-A mutase-associated GTPase MeaB [Caldimonas sp.]
MPRPAAPASADAVAASSASASAARLTERALAGDRRALARLLTLIDDEVRGAAAAAATLAKRAGRAWVVGITGVPGSGKSTLIDTLLARWLAQGHSIAVIAIDPSSPVSGGAVLGDRIRMGAHAAHPNVFIRSFSARGELGGLSRAARAAVDAFDACGFDRVIVETVGAGQSETAIVALADTRVVVCPPGLGDGVQAIKAGTLEIADVLAISKGDLPLAEQTARDMREMLSLRRHPAPGDWTARVVVVSALAGSGVDELLAALDRHREAAGVGRRGAVEARVDAGKPSPAGATTAALDAAGWRDRIAGLVADDGLCRTLGITFRSGGPGRAEVAMTIDARHLNFNGGGHGGAIFSLADSAFGLASNSHGPVASGIAAHITYQAAVGAGDTLVARATEVQRSRRIGVYRIDVVREDGRGGETAVSSFTGTVYVKG